MPASKEIQEYVEKELPYKILMHIYEDSRAPLRELGREVGISHHTISKVLRELEKKYDIRYTLDLDLHALGFHTGKLVTIKFGRTPNTDFLKKRLQGDFFVQDAYLASGDFDLLLFVVGLTPEDFQRWQFMLRVELSAYKPAVNVSDMNMYMDGFLPVRNELIRSSETISEVEKRVLIALNDNSRIKMKELAKTTKLSPTSIFYIMNKLKTNGVIKKYTALTQNPSKRLLMAYSVRLTPIREHSSLSLNMAKAIVAENYHEVTNDYCVVANTNGAVDTFYICTFKDGESLSKRGPALVQILWRKEEPAIMQALLIGLLVGRWPFHLDNHAKHIAYIKREEKPS
ncbi:MAG: winged helix-turn-helix transcriptional regulator [Candidatus Micrarchaeota archaeon]|nr:winged helix-turn-helix transcriptional regulator [Candidatus Micrarchaeota archaeon]